MIVVMVICLGVLIFSGIKLWSILSGYNRLVNTYNGLADEVITPVEPGETVVENETDTDTETEEKAVVLPLDYPPIEVDFDSLLSTNPDVVGWLYCADTNINYPVVQGEDNSVYLHALWDGSGTYNSGGTLYIDCLNSRDFSDDNTIFYGHNMKNGSMFHNLRYYYSQGQDYYDSHPYMYLLTPNGNYRLEVFSCHSTSSNSSVYTIGFGSTESFQNYLDSAISASTFTTDIDVTTEDRIVTLSTCAYLYENARYVVHAKLVEIN